MYKYFVSFIMENEDGDISFKNCEVILNDKIDGSETLKSVSKQIKENFGIESITILFFREFDEQK